MTKLPELDWNDDPVEMSLPADAMAAGHSLGVVKLGPEGPIAIMLSLVDDDELVKSFLVLPLPQAAELGHTIIAYVKEAGC